MALRPVSDLGLVDLTDLAEPGKGGQTRRAPKPTQKPKPPKASATPPSAPTRRVRRKAAGVARTGMVVATWTAAGACGIVLGRAAVRR